MNIELLIAKLSQQQKKELYAHIKEKYKVSEDADYLTAKFGGSVEALYAKIPKEMIEEYVRYRATIKKPIKTFRALRSYAKSLEEAEGYDIKCIQSIVMDNEWLKFDKRWKAFDGCREKESLKEFGI